MARHQWITKDRSIVSTCAKCGLRRIRRWAYNTHWTEWQRPDGSYVESRPGVLAEKTPPCEPQIAEKAEAA